jgi:hypothetical protein
MATESAALDWMLDTDPALRWQVERDLAGAPPKTWEATRARVATEGCGARLLSLQDADGQWAGGSYFPADFDWHGPEAAKGAGQPWTATTWSLNALREWGLDASVLAGTAEKLAANSRWDYNGGPYWQGEVDCCINAYTIANGAWLGTDVSELANWFPAHQMADGGWNCEWEEGSIRSSFHSTLNSLKGLLYYEGTTGGTPELTAARHAAEEYLLARRLMYRLSTGERHDAWATHFAYPFRWFYSLPKALDYFRAAARFDGTAPDARLSEAVEVLRSARQADGKWLQERVHPGRVWFDVDVPVGEASPWLTFYCQRALDWWDAGTHEKS